MKTLNEYKVETVIQFLIDNISLIPNTKVWIQKTEVSKSWLYQNLKKKFHKTPRQIVQEVRFETVVQLIRKDLEAQSCEIAIEAGLISSDNKCDALYKFLSRSYSTNFTELKMNILNNKIQLQRKWIHGEWKYRRQLNQIGDNSC